MADISTSFVGLQLQSPIIIGSSGLTRNLDKVKAMAEAGAGAVILKSLFEEQIEAEAQQMQQHSDYTEASEYVAHYVRAEEVNRYLDMIKLYKKELSIPVIASINCIKSDSWISFASKIQEAGADALEVNIMRLETDLFFDPIASEKGYCEIVSKLRAQIGIPIIIKLSKYHTALPALVDKLRASGANAVTIFNRTYQPDIDLNKEEFRSGDIFTHMGDFTDTLRFSALLSKLVPQMEVSTSTGVYTWQEVTKSLLTGAQTAQMCTALYKEGVSAITDALAALGMWMDKHGYRSIDEFRGRMSAATSSTEDTNIFERIQFMKYFGGRGDS